MPREDDVHGLLDRISRCGDEYTVGSAREEMYKFRAESLARPNAERVAVLRARFHTRLREIIKTAEREGVM